MKYIITLLVMFFLSGGTPLFAQGCFDDNIEDELLGYFKEMHRLRNSPGEDSQDSLKFVNNQFYHFLCYAAERNYTLVDDLNRLLYEGLDFSISEDNNCSVFSWELYTDKGMHYRNGVVFYKGSEGIHSVKYLDGFAPYSVSSVHTRDGNTLYLMLWEDCYSLKGRFKRISANVIDTRFGQEGLMPASVFCNNNTDSVSYLEYKYDLISYSNPIDVPDITWSHNRKRISVPVVANTGYFGGNYNVYNFDGNKFILEKAVNNKAINGKAN